MDACVLHIGIMECCGQGYIQLYPTKSAKLTSYATSRQGIYRLYNSKIL